MSTADRLRISLKENGLHSLWRGIAAYEEYQSSPENKMLLKDTVMFFHHGVELLMKEILVRRSEYLIFEDLSKATESQKKANEQGVGIFFLQKPPNTVGYIGAIDRIKAFIDPPELDESLHVKLRKLNSLRNQLEHYSVDADAEEIVRLIAAVRYPLLDLFEAQIGRIELPIEISQTLDGIQNEVHEYVQLVREVCSLVKNFRGQRVPGYLFNVEDVVTLPTFTRVMPEHYVSESAPMADVWCEGEIDAWGKRLEVRWAIGMRLAVFGIDDFRATEITFDTVLRNLTYFRVFEKVTAWLVGFVEVPDWVIWEAREQNILVTGLDEWDELKGLVSVEAGDEHAR